MHIFLLSRIIIFNFKRLILFKIVIFKQFSLFEFLNFFPF